MKHFIIVLIVLIGGVSFIAEAQNEVNKTYTAYYEKTTKAFIAKIENNYDQAAALYEEAFSDYYPFHDDMASLRDCYLALGDTNRAIDCVKRMIACGWQSKETIPVIGQEVLHEHEIGNFDSLTISYILEIQPALRQEYLRQINQEENAYLYRIMMNEIFCQDLRWCKFNKRKYKKPLDMAWEQNVDELINLLKNKELDRRKVDVWNRSEFEITIIHCAQTVWNNESKFDELMSVLKQEIKKGNISPHLYATAYDVVFWQKSKFKKSFYGNQTVYDEKAGGRVCIEIEDVENVDKRRAEIGLPPLWAYCKMYNRIPPKNYKQ